MSETSSLKGAMRSYAKYAEEYGPYSTTKSVSKRNKLTTIGESFSSSAVSEQSFKFSSSTKPNVALTGLARSGKTKSTGRIIKHDVSNSAFCQFELWDLPPELLQSDSDSSPTLEDILSICSALIFVLDTTTESPDETLQQLHHTIVRAYTVNPNIHMEVFIHKTDVLSEEQKISFQREIQEHVDGELRDIGLDRVASSISYRLTSIFDHSIFEAFSQVAQSLNSQTSILERLLDTFVDNSGVENAFLFDIVSKLVIATDSSPVHAQDFELCSDMIDVAIDIGGIYSLDYPCTGGMSSSLSTERVGRYLDDKNSTAAVEESHHEQIPSCSLFEGNSCWSTIRLGSGMVLYMRNVGYYLCLVTMIRGEIFDSSLGLVGHNIRIFRDCLWKMIQLQ